MTSMFWTVLNTLAERSPGVLSLVLVGILFALLIIVHLITTRAYTLRWSSGGGLELKPPRSPGRLPDRLGERREPDERPDDTGDGLRPPRRLL